jgi:hypothetical protein
MTTRKNWVLTPICVAILAGCGSSDQSTPTATTSATDPDTAADQRAASLVGQMTLDEKIHMVHGIGAQLAPPWWRWHDSRHPAIGNPGLLYYRLLHWRIAVYQFRDCRQRPNGHAVPGRPSPELGPHARA